METCATDMIFVGRQIKSRILWDNRAVQEMTFEFMPRDLWRIVTDYVCEDPRIVDILLKKDWLLQGAADFEGCVQITNNYHCCSHCGLGDTTYELRESVDGRIKWAVTYADMFRFLLMLPQIDSSGIEVCTEAGDGDGSSIHDARMRELLYRELE